MAKVTKLKQKKEFAEELGIFFEQMGIPRAAGKIWGWLMVCTPPEQTAADLAKAVGVSRGSVSTMTRMLMQLELIERIGVPGDRKGYYRIKAGGFAGILESKARMTSMFRQMAERGLELMNEDPPAARQRLEECREFYAFFEREFPNIIKKWNRSRKSGKKA